MTLSKELFQEGIISKLLCSFYFRIYIYILILYILYTHTHISAVSMNIGHIAGLYLVTIDFI